MGQKKVFDTICTTTKANEPKLCLALFYFFYYLLHVKMCIFSIQHGTCTVSTHQYRNNKLNSTNPFFNFKAFVTYFIAFNFVPCHIVVEIFPLFSDDAIIINAAEEEESGFSSKYWYKTAVDLHNSLNKEEKQSLCYWDHQPSLCIINIYKYRCRDKKRKEQGIVHKPLYHYQHVGKRLYVD